MAFYVDEEEVWKCLNHPSKRRRSGICPVCLRDRLATLCPDCANVRPCGCYATTSSSSSDSSSLFARFAGDTSGLGSIGRVSSLIESEPSFRRSRSLAIPFLRSRSRFVGEFDTGTVTKSPSFWSIFKLQKSRKVESEKGRGGLGELSKRDEIDVVNDDVMRRTMMIRSRSVAAPVSGSGNVRQPTKGRGWYFPSPIKAFRQSRISKVVHERSPLHRG